MRRRDLLALPAIATAEGDAAGAVPGRYRIEVRKRSRELLVYDRDQLGSRFRIALGFSPEGHKQLEGDGRTPEGWYRLVRKNARSKFYRSVMIDYPSQEDARHAFRVGRISALVRDAILNAHQRGTAPPQNTALGGEIFIHGGGAKDDWTLGCIALENTDMDVVFALPLGTKVLISA